MIKEEEIAYFRKYVIKQYIDEVMHGYNKVKDITPKYKKTLENGKIKYIKIKSKTTEFITSEKPKKAC